MHPDPHANTLALVTLGCPKNQIDSEIMAGSLHRDGWITVGSVEGADTAIVNTCAFIAEAVEESMEAIRSVASLKAAGSLRRLIVAGCLGQRYGRRLFQEIPEVDFVVGTGEVGRIAQICRLLKDESAPRGVAVGWLDRLDIPWSQRAVISGPSAYLKIAEGCDRTCTFCIIPSFRGLQRSRRPDDIVEEARRLAAAGVREVILIGQDTTAYGHDLPERPDLALLLERLEEIEDLAWIRVLYTHPAGWNDRLIDAFARLRRTVPYVDMPVQHTQDEILKAMRRGISWGKTRGLIRRMREGIPELTLRTTLLLAFPGETEGHFEGLLEDIQETPFDRLGVFSYSPEPESPAATLPDPVPAGVAQERCRRVLEAQRSVSMSLLQKRIGRTLAVLVEECHPDGRSAWGRGPGDAPEIDGKITLDMSERPGARVGDLVMARVVAAGPYDLAATPVAGSREEIVV
jgi:ribosomal protein S12 methylthiotransferase